MTDDEIIAVVTAHKEGKQLQSRSRIQNGYGWRNMNHAPVIEWNFLSFDYRIKPQARQWWIYPVPNKDSCAIEHAPAPGFVHVREVLEETP